MSKPDDIPQDVWATAEKMASEYRRWVDHGNTLASLSDHAEAAMADSFARAILAERERCAKVCADEIEQARQLGPHHIPVISGIAAAIRKGGD